MKVHLELKAASTPRRATTLAGQLSLPVPVVRLALARLHAMGQVQRDTEIVTHAEDARYRPRSRFGRVPETLKRLTRRGNWATAAEVAEEARVSPESALEALAAMQARRTAHSKRVGHLTLWRHGRAA